MAEITDKILPLLEIARNGLMVGATFLAKFIPFEAENIYLLIVIILSLWASSKILSILPTLRGNWLWWLGLAFGIFYILKYL